MKLKLILCLLLTIAAFFSKAQFAPVGTVWNYVDWHPWLWPESHNVKITIQKDTVIQGKTYSKFEDGCFKTLDSGRVYYFAQNAPRLLFDYNAQQGDTVEIECHTQHPDTIYTVSIKIDSIYYIKDLDLDRVKAYNIQRMPPFDPWMPSSSTVYEKFFMGDNPQYTIKSEDLFPPLLEARGMHFYCYREPNGFNFTLIDTGYCDVVSTYEVEQLQTEISVYPNPANQLVHIQNTSNRAISTIELYSNTGKRINDLSITQHEIEVSSFKTGTYWLIITLDNQVRIPKKIVVAR